MANKKCDSEFHNRHAITVKDLINITVPWCEILIRDEEVLGEKRKTLSGTPGIKIKSHNIRIRTFAYN